MKILKEIGMALFKFLRIPILGVFILYVICHLLILAVAGYIEIVGIT